MAGSTCQSSRSVFRALQFMIVDKDVTQTLAAGIASFEDRLTLSACETAKGGGAEGDEVESFGAIAQMNGASADMATLLPITDEPSGQLMADFHKGLCG